MPRSDAEQHYLSWPETGALILSLSFVGVTIGGSSPLVSSLLEARGFSEYFTGGVVAMLSLGLALSSPAAGRLVERFGARNVNVVGILASGMGFGALQLALVWDERLLFGVRLWLGAVDALIFVAAEYALLKGTRPSHRARVMAAYTAGFGLGFMSGVFLSDPLYELFGFAVFWLFASSATVIAPIAYWGLRAESFEPRATLGDVTAPSTLPWKGLVIAFYGAVVYAVMDIAMSGIYPVEGQRLGLTRAQSLNIVGWMAFGTVMIQPVAGWLADRFGNLRLLCVLAAVGLGASLAAGYNSALWLPERVHITIIAFTLVGCAAGGIFPISLALLGERSPVAGLSRANAVFSSVFGYASLSAPFVAASFIDLAERLDVVGWAVPALAVFTFAAALPLALLDLHWRTAKPDVVQDDDTTAALEAKPERG